MPTIDLAFSVLIENPFEFGGTSRRKLLQSESDFIDSLIGTEYFVPKVWGQRSYIRSKLRQEDIQAAKISLAMAKDLIAEFLHSELPSGSDFEFEEFEVRKLGFGCIKLEVWAKIKSTALVVGLLAGCSAMYVNHFEKKSKQSYVSCSSFLGSRINLGTHLKIITEQSPEVLFDRGNAACTRLKQKTLQLAGLYDGNVDGKFGDRTADAERNFAKLRGIRATDTDRIYESLASYLLSEYPPIGN